MTSNMIITLEDNTRYFLVYEKDYNNKKYFLGNKLDNGDHPTGETTIFEEIKYNDDSHLEIVTDEQTLNFLSTYFTAGFIKEVEEEYKKKED